MKREYLSRIKPFVFLKKIQQNDKNDNNIKIFIFVVVFAWDFLQCYEVEFLHTNSID